MLWQHSKMNKDAILATVIGFGVGLAIAALVFLAPALFKNVQFRLPTLRRETAAPTPTPTPNEILTIQSPLPEAIEPKNETLVSGTTAPESIVVIEGATTETVAVANGDGAYAGKIALSEGKNDITVTSYTKDKVQTQTVRVYSTPEDF